MAQPVTDCNILYSGYQHVHWLPVLFFYLKITLQIAVENVIANYQRISSHILYIHRFNYVSVLFMLQTFINHTFYIYFVLYYVIPDCIIVTLFPTYFRINSMLMKFTFANDEFCIISWTHENLLSWVSYNYLQTNSIELEITYLFFFYIYRSSFFTTYIFGVMIDLSQMEWRAFKETYTLQWVDKGSKR